MPYPAHYVSKDVKITSAVTSNVVEQMDRAAENLAITRAEFIRDAVMKRLSEVEIRSQAAE